MATAKGIREIATAINEKGGSDAVNLRIAEQYLGEFGKLAKVNNTLIIPADLGDTAGMVAAVSKVFTATRQRAADIETGAAPAAALPGAKPAGQHYPPLQQRPSQGGQ